MGLNGAKWGKRGQIGPNGVKLLSIDDSYFLHNMAKVEKLMTDLRKDEVPKKVEPRRQLQGALSTSCKCCCHGHCKFSVHTVGGALQGVSLDKRSEVDVGFPTIYERDLSTSTEISA